MARRAEVLICASVSWGVSRSDESGDVGRVEGIDRPRREGGRKRDVRLGEGGRGVDGLL